MKRYQPVARIDNHSYSVDIRLTEMKECKDGGWVRWEDVKEMIEEYQKIINEEQNDINYL